nr:unnamed protein product [Callosobruchus chinensis]
MILDVLGITENDNRQHIPSIPDAKGSKRCAVCPRSQDRKGRDNCVKCDETCVQSIDMPFVFLYTIKANKTSSIFNLVIYLFKTIVGSYLTPCCRLC